jgi:hypothetical protein
MSEHEKTSDPEHVTDEELAEIGRLDNDATPGPWIDTGDAVISDAERDCDDMSYVVVEPYCRPADRAFIAAARTLPALTVKSMAPDAVVESGVSTLTRVAHLTSQAMHQTINPALSGVCGIDQERMFAF